MLINYGKVNVFAFSPSLKLIPGINKVSDADWAKVKDHPKVKAYLADGTLKVVDGKADEIEPGSADAIDETLSGLSEKKAIDLIDETVDENLLLSWKSGEKRGKVIKAIDEQLAAIAKA
jgi:hypothetical protein